MKREDGFGAIFSVVVVAVISTMAIGLFLLVDQTIFQSENSAIIAARADLEADLRMSIKYGPMLLASIDNNGLNQELRACLFDDAAFDGSWNDCRVSRYPVSLYEFRSGQKVMIIGRSTQQPAYYNEIGQLCDETNPAKCAFKVYGDFVPKCNGGALACNIAESATFNITIEPTESLSRLRPLSLSQLVIISDGSPKAISRPAQVQPPLAPAPAATPDPGPAQAANSEPALDPPAPAPAPAPVMTMDTVFCGAGKVARNGQSCSSFRF